MAAGCYVEARANARRDESLAGRAIRIRSVRAVLRARAIVLATLLLACGPGVSPDSTIDRWAARYQGGKPIWVRESTLPKEPQQKPRMVIYEVSRYAPGTSPTPEQARAAQDLVDRCFAAAKRNGWFQFQNGLEQGYLLLFGDKRHYVKPRFVFDAAVLDCDRPEFLMYYDTPNGKGLAGLMFYADTPTGWGAQIGGPLTVWHYHVWAPVQCLRERLLLVGTADESGHCVKGLPTHRSPEMVHVWFIDRPNGPFASSMHLRDDEIAMLTHERSPPRLRLDADMRARARHE
jgi:hypothetical protein